jgi:uncharacterized membrane protein
MTDQLSEMPAAEKAPRSLLSRMRRIFITGLIILLPLLITVTLLYFLFKIINAYITPLVRRLIDLIVSGVFGAALRDFEPFLRSLTIPIGLLLTLLLIFLLGALGTNLIGRRILKSLDRLILRIPLVKSVYGAAQQLMQSIRFSHQAGFSRVVLVEYPRRGLWTMGFLTQEYPGGMEGFDRGDLVSVFLPTTPNPTSGWLVVTPRSEVRLLDLTIEDGVKFIISGGIVGPPMISSSLLMEDGDVPLSEPGPAGEN